MLRAAARHGLGAPRTAGLAASVRARAALPSRSPMSDTTKIAKNLQAFQIAINAHDRENPTHNAYGIGLAHFDLERLGFDEGEEILPGITIHADDGVTGNFRVLCDGQHDEDLEREAQEADVVEAVAAERGITIAPGGERQRESDRVRGRRHSPKVAPGRSSSARRRSTDGAWGVQGGRRALLRALTRPARHRRTAAAASPA